MAELRISVQLADDLFWAIPPKGILSATLLSPRWRDPPLAQQGLGISTVSDHAQPPCTDGGQRTAERSSARASILMRCHKGNWHGIVEQNTAERNAAKNTRCISHSFCPRKIASALIRSRLLWRGASQGYSSTGIY